MTSKEIRPKLGRQPHQQIVAARELGSSATREETIAHERTLAARNRRQHERMLVARTALRAGGAQAG
jgi:hypothetical protein